MRLKLKTVTLKEKTRRSRQESGRKGETKGLTRFKD